jgi:uncharacterized protein (TIGR02266 family)
VRDGVVPANRRASDRQRIRRQVLFRYEKQRVFNVDATADISHGGLFIATTRPLVVGARVVGFLRADNKGEAPPIRFDGEVAWRSPRLEDSPKGPGIGVRFTHLDLDARRRLDRMLASFA